MTMARPVKDSNEAILTRAISVFRSAGYEGASLSRLSEASGLKRASLYHRFPGGKEEIAAETLRALSRWIDAQIIQPLRRPGDPRKRLETAAAAFDTLFDNGRDASIIALFGTPDTTPEPLVEGAQRLLLGIISAIGAVLEEAGFSGDDARTRAVRGMVLLEGAVAVARTFRDPAPFRATLATWPDDLLTNGQAIASPAPQPDQPAPKPASEEPPSDVRKAVARHLAALRAARP
ncbi:MAG: TetR/AcrR family transcriptional regulator [Pseudomonadota bacterium]